MGLLDSSARRYLVVGVFNTALDIGLFTALSVGLHVHPVPANVVSTVVVMTVSFFINRSFVFGADDAGVRSYVAFVGVTLFSGWVVQSLVIVGFLAAAGSLAPNLSDAVAKPAAKIVATAVGMVSNFLGYRWVFARSSSAGAAGSSGSSAS